MPSSKVKQQLEALDNPRKHTHPLTASSAHVQQTQSSESASEWLVPRNLSRRAVPRILASCVFVVLFAVFLLSLVAYLPALAFTYKYGVQQASNGLLEASVRSIVINYQTTAQSPLDRIVGRLGALRRRRLDEGASEQDALDGGDLQLLLEGTLYTRGTLTLDPQVAEPVGLTATDSSLVLSRRLPGGWLTSVAFPLSAFTDNLASKIRTWIEDPANDFSSNFNELARATDGAAELHVSANVSEVLVSLIDGAIVVRTSQAGADGHAHANSAADSAWFQLCTEPVATGAGETVFAICAAVVNVPRELQNFVVLVVAAVIVSVVVTAIGCTIAYVGGRVWADSTRRRLGADLAKYAPPQHAVAVKDNNGGVGLGRHLNRRTVASVVIGYFRADDAWAAEPVTMMDAFDELKTTIVSVCREYGACPACALGSGSVMVIGPTTAITAVAIRMSAWRPTRHVAVVRPIIRRRMPMLSEAEMSDNGSLMSSTYGGAGPSASGSTHNPGASVPAGRGRPAVHQHNGGFGAGAAVVGEEELTLRVGCIVHALIGCAISPAIQVADWHDTPAFAWRLTGRDVVLHQALLPALIPAVVVATSSARALMAACDDLEHVALHLTAMTFGTTEVFLQSGERCMVTGSLLTRRRPRPSDADIPGATECAALLSASQSFDTATPSCLTCTSGRLDSGGNNTSHGSLNVLSLSNVTLSRSRLSTDSPAQQPPPRRSGARDDDPNASGSRTPPACPILIEPPRQNLVALANQSVDPQAGDTYGVLLPEHDRGFKGPRPSVDHATRTAEGKIIPCLILRAIDAARDNIIPEDSRSAVLERLPIETWNHWRPRRPLNTNARRRHDVIRQFREGISSAAQKRTGPRPADLPPAGPSNARAGRRDRAERTSSLSAAVGIDQALTAHSQADRSGAGSESPPITPSSRLRLAMASTPSESSDSDDDFGNASTDRKPPTTMTASDLRSDIGSEEDLTTSRRSHAGSRHQLRTEVGALPHGAPHRPRPRNVSFSTQPPQLVSPLADLHSDSGSGDDGSPGEAGRGGPAPAGAAGGRGTSSAGLKQYRDHARNLPPSGSAAPTGGGDPLAKIRSIPLEFADTSLICSRAVPTCVCGLADARALCGFVLDFMPRREMLKVRTPHLGGNGGDPFNNSGHSATSSVATTMTFMGRNSPQHLVLLRTTVSLASHFLLAFRTLCYPLDLGATHRMTTRVSTALGIEPPLPWEEDSGDSQLWFARLAARCAVLVVFKMRQTTMWSPPLPDGTPAGFITTPAGPKSFTVGPGPAGVPFPAAVTVQAPTPNPISGLGGGRDADSRPPISAPVFNAPTKPNRPRSPRNRDLETRPSRRNSRVPKPEVRSPADAEPARLFLAVGSPVAPNPRSQLSSGSSDPTASNPATRCETAVPSEQSASQHDLDADADLVAILSTHRPSVVDSETGLVELPPSASPIGDELRRGVFDEMRGSGEPPEHQPMSRAGRPSGRTPRW
jgi:hypothetical protein